MQRSNNQGENRMVSGVSVEFSVCVELHQVSPLDPFLCVVLLDVLMESVGKPEIWEELLYAD